MPLRKDKEKEWERSKIKKRIDDEEDFRYWEKSDQ